MAAGSVRGAVSVSRCVLLLQGGGLVCLSVDGGERLLAAGSARGAVNVLACPAAGGWSGQLTALARLEAAVQALCWRPGPAPERLLYVGTAAGKVLAISVNSKVLRVVGTATEAVIEFIHRLVYGEKAFVRFEPLYRACIFLCNHLSSYRSYITHTICVHNSNNIITKKNRKTH